MTDLLIAGGLLFTVPLTILAIIVAATAIAGAVAVLRRGEDASFWTRMLFHLGLFSFILGVLGQGIGLYQAMTVIEAMGGVSPALLMGGLKVSMIAPMFGLIIFVAAMLCRLGLDLASRRISAQRA